MKRILGITLATCLFSMTFALSATPVLDYVEKDLHKKEAGLIQNMPSEVSYAYMIEMQKMYDEIIDAKYSYEYIDLSREELRDIIAPMYQKYKELKSDNTNYLKNKKSQYLITETEKSKIRSEIIAYQNEIVKRLEQIINESYDNYRNEGKFTIAIKNTLVDIQVNSPKIISRVKTEGTTKSEIELEIKAEIKGEAAIKIDGEISIEMITDDEALYFRIINLEVVTAGDATMKQSIDEMVTEAKKMMQKIGDKYIVIPIETQSAEQLKEAIKIWKTEPLFVPFKRTGDNNFTLTFNEELAGEIGIEYSLLSKGNTDIEIELQGEGSRIGFCSAEGLGKNYLEDAKICSYIKHINNRPLQIKMYTSDPYSTIDVMINELGKDFRGLFTDYEKNEAKILWTEGRLTASLDDNKNIYTAEGALTSDNADITLRKDAAPIGKILWNKTGATTHLGWDIQLWDEYDTYVSGDFANTKSTDTSVINIPTNIINIDELTPTFDDAYDDMGNYDDQSDDYDVPTISGTMTQKEVKQILLKNHTQTFGKSDIALIVFTDMECPFCQRYAQTLGDLSATESFELNIKHYPLPFHPNAENWAKESECVAKKLGNSKFFEYVNTRMVDLNEGEILGEFGFSEKEITECKKSRETISIIKRDEYFATKYNINGTPGTIVLNKKTGYYEIISGSFPTESIIQVINRVK